MTRDENTMKRFVTKLLPPTFVVFSLLIGSDCKKDPVTPIDETQPGRRDYTWVVDTVVAGGNDIASMDGVSPTDVWIASPAGDFTQTLYHFDGTHWTTDGINRPLSPRGIYALKSNEAWCVGEEGEIWNYDGHRWVRHVQINVAGNPYRFFNDIRGTASDLFAVGGYSSNGSIFHPMICHYDGNRWSQIQAQNISSQLLRITGLSDRHWLVLGERNQENVLSLDTSQIFRFDRQNLVQIYGAVAGRSGYAFLSQVQNGVFIVRGKKISFTNGNSEAEILTVDSGLFGNAVEGRTVKDILLLMFDGIAHFNGSDIQYLHRFAGNNVHIRAIKLFEKSAFVAAYDLDRNLNLIYRGYLQ